jgi:hypothetical protein
MRAATSLGVLNRPPLLDKQTPRSPQAGTKANEDPAGGGGGQPRSLAPPGRELTGQHGARGTRGPELLGVAPYVS